MLVVFVADNLVVSEEVSAKSGDRKAFKTGPI
jgi:hypothetical protein